MLPDFAYFSIYYASLQPVCKTYYNTTYSIDQDNGKLAKRLL